MTSAIPSTEDHDPFTFTAHPEGMQDDAGGRTPADEEGATRYTAFLLRVWRRAGGAGDSWRIVLEAVGSEERRGFTEWNALVEHISDSLARPER